MRITESQLRQIIRQEARRLTEGTSTSKASIIADSIADSIVDEIGMEGAAELQAAFRSGTPAGIATLEELIDDHSDGMMDAASPKVQDKVCVAIEVMLGLAPPARKGRAPSGRKPARFDTNDMYGELPPWMTR